MLDEEREVTVRRPRWEVWHEDQGTPRSVVARTYSEESAYLCAILNTLQLSDRAKDYNSYTVHTAGSLEAKRQMDEAKKAFKHYNYRGFTND